MTSNNSESDVKKARIKSVPFWVSEKLACQSDYTKCVQEHPQTAFSHIFPWDQEKPIDRCILYYQACMYPVQRLVHKYYANSDK